MKIIQVTGSDVGGGAETVVRQHHHQLIRQGHQVQLLVGRKQTEDPDTTQIPFRRGPKGVLRTARWLQRNTGLQNLYSPGFRAIEDSFAFPPDIIHFHSLHGVDSFAELSVVKTLCRKYPVMISLHDLWLMTGHCGHPLSCTRWKVGCGSCPDLTLYPAVSRDATRWNFRRKQRLFRDTSVRLIVPSSWLKDQVQQSPILQHLPVTVVPNPVDIDVFSPGPTAARKEQHGIEASDRTIILVAQHLNNPFKGIEDGIAVINQLNLQNLKVILVGNSADQVAQRIDHASVILPFTKSKEELAGYYRMADLLLMPSRGETFGLVAAEAMACGTPVVAFRTGGLVDVIGDEGAGVLVPPGELTVMARQISQLLADDPARSEMADQAIERVRQRFTLTQHCRKLLEQYQHAIQRKQTGGKRLSGDTPG